ncbi:cation/H(+) antiporter [Streptacidiphilus sp. PB12-B1b]|uniref:cation:proton antiporter domain-containing protein n=1 Tax=Streptacidiphilus sp. PB12-B1b TaxID=2705012 RepID=UPI0015FDBC3C|nr:cation:proton antiporter [Streptacidiphilus sp. PB12-B1b]QMU77052.1 cation/H(+) antiporter [Streptacidiphilus sp. PB12-B1b]
MVATPSNLPVEAVVLADVAVVLAVSVLMVQLAKRLGQPPVVAEILAGLMLGPSLLGLLPGDLPARLFPADARTPLSAIAQLGLALFLFSTGWELDLRRLRGSGRTLGAVAVSSMAVPFAVGGGIAALLYRSQAPRGVSSTVFVLFLATAFSITAFPVLARLIRDRGLSRTRIGSMAMACAAGCDVAAWCVLVLVTAMATAKGTDGFVTTVALTLVYAAVMVFAVRPLLRRVLRGGSVRWDSTTQLVLIAAGALLSSYVTSWIGVHAFFGAFAFGLVMPRRHADTTGLEQRIAAPLDKAAALLLPVFFVITGLSVNVTVLGRSGLLVLLLALAAAVAGKFAGTALPARLGGMGWRDASLLGTLMNTRGLTEIVVLGIGNQLGIIGPELFTVMVLIALITTAMAGPLLRLMGVGGPDAPEEPLPVPRPRRAREQEPLDAQPV